jgi:peroxiredoxin
MHSDQETQSASDSRAEIAATPDAEPEIEWGTPPFQPIRALSALALTAAGFAIYELVLLNFWSSESLGIHERIPWPSYLLIALALLVTLAGVRVALSIWSPHAKMGFSLLAIFAAVAVGIGGGRFVSYTMRGTLNPPYHLTLAVGDQFPAFTLTDQKGTAHDGPVSPGAKAMLVYVYPGDYDAFARHEIGDLTALRPELRRSGADVIAISTDSIDRSKMLSGYLHTDIPLLSDEKENVVGPLGLVQKHRNGEPDNAIPAFFVVDSTGEIRWIFSSPYYRELPPSDALIAAVRSVIEPLAH